MGIRRKKSCRILRWFAAMSPFFEPDVLEIQPPAETVTLSNQAAYALSGNCDPLGQSVDVEIATSNGTLMNTVACDFAGRWFTAFDLSAALDGNLTEALLDQIVHHPAFAAADLRIAPASPGKAERLLPFIRAGKGVLYVNLEEAGLLCQTEFVSAPQAGAALMERGAARALVTDGGNVTCDATKDGILAERPPEVMVTRVTGAGDTFMAAHIASELRGADRPTALHRALATAAAYVAGGT